MESAYHSLEYGPVSRTAVLYRPSHTLAGTVTTDDSALKVMTDFQNVRPFTIEGNANLDGANDKMLACGVRLLFVVDSFGAVEGLVTSHDILGDKPIRYTHEHAGHRGDILVRDVMAPNDALEAVSLAEVERARVGDIVETINRFGRQHLLVVEDFGTGGPQAIRGLFSLTQIGRQLGRELWPTHRGGSYAEQQTLISRGG